MQSRRDDPLIVALYRRILRAARHGKGVRLSHDEAVRMATDSAIETLVLTHDDTCHTGWSYGTGRRRAKS
jgi:urease gamma subunit